MRTTPLMLQIALALAAAPLTAPAQDTGPRVLFCAGECVAVDAKGVRTPAPKGTPLLPGQQLQTGLGGYAQVKLSPALAVGVDERARVRFEHDAIVLDQGRIRMVGGEAFGKRIGTPVELRTPDGTVVLRGADLEAKKTGQGATATPTLVKVNAGDARLRDGAEEVRLPTQALQGIERGKLAGAPIPVTDILPPRRETGAPAGRGPVALPAAPMVVPPRLLEPRTTFVLSPTLTTSLKTATTYTTTNLQPVLTSADLLLNSTVVDSSGTKTTFNDVLKSPTLDPVLTFESKTLDSRYTATIKEQTICSTCTEIKRTIQLEGTKLTF